MARGSAPTRQTARGPSRHNLPTPLTSFIGREREIVDVRRRLATTRLLTLTGAAGVGKTRLALEVARTTDGEWPDGVWLVELAPLSDPSLVPQAIAAALEVREQPDRPLLTTLTDHLQSRSLLLMRDNCEHLVAACASLAEHLLETCPGLQILATSREALGAAGESLWRVPGLALPEPDAEAAVSADGKPARAEAVRLFYERALATLPDFTLTERSAPLVVEVCRQLGGIPLAIELAAARVGVLSMDQIVARLDDQFRLLTSGRRTALPRHRTLRTLVDWSHDLLPTAERILLRRLAVFAGGWTLEAAEVVCAGDGIAREDVLDLLSQLAAKSLVQVDDQGMGRRYRFLETIRQYAAERLRDADEEPGLRRRHREWVLALAEEAEPYLLGPEQRHWVERLTRDLDNVRAALDWSVSAANGDDLTIDNVALRIAGALLFFWYHDRFGEGRRWLERVLGSARDAAAPARAKALAAAGHLAYYQGDFDLATRQLEDGLALYRELGDGRGAAFALASLGYAAQYRGEYTRAPALLEESLELARATDNTWAVGRALQNLGAIAHIQGDHERARSLLEQSLSIWRDVAGAPAMILSLHNLGLVAHARGDETRAAALLEESLGFARGLNNHWWIAMVLHSLGRVEHAVGRHQRAAALHRESLTLWIAGGDKRSIAEALEGQAGVAIARRDADRAARLLGAAEALREAIGSPVPPADRNDYERDRATVLAMLDRTALATAWAEGHAMGWREAAAYALEQPPDAPPSAPAGRPTRDPWSVAGGPPLSPREREVALLIARGLMNRQIAAALVIGDRTVESHVTNIFTKLGLTSRSQITAWVVERGLLADAEDESSAPTPGYGILRRR